jgi:hypothetical protein
MSRNQAENSHNNQRESVLDDTDLREEQELVDLFFKRIDTAKAVTGSWVKLWFFVCSYSFCTISACIAIYLDSFYGSDTALYYGENALVVILILLQSFTCGSSVMLLKSLLANQAICAAYVEFNILDYMRRFPEPSPAISLYFKGHVSPPKKRMNIKQQIKSDRRLIRYFYYKFGILTLLTIYFWISAALSSDTTGYAIIVLPWGLMTFSAKAINSFIFAIIRDSLEYHKRELLKSPVFSNEKWEDLIKVLSNATRFRQRGHVVENIPWFQPEDLPVPVDLSMGSSNLEMGNIYHHNSIVSSTGKPSSPLHINEHPQSQSQPERPQSVNSQRSSSPAEGESKNIFDSGIESAGQSLQRVLSDSSSIATYFLQQTANNVIPQLPTGIQINLLKHEALHNRQQMKEAVYKILTDEGEALDIQRFRQDLFLLQHVYCVYNSVLGFAFSINAVLTLWLLVYILYITLTVGNFQGPILVVFEYVVIISVYTIYQNISLLLNSNSISTAINAFFAPLILLCPAERLDELATLQSSIGSMNLYIRVFGISITQEYCFSLFFSLALSVSGQLYKILVSKS